MLPAIFLCQIFSSSEKLELICQFALLFLLPSFHSLQLELFARRLRIYLSTSRIVLILDRARVSNNNLEDISSDKDFEDAKHIYALFKDKLNKEELSNFVKLLKIEKKMEWLKK